MKKLLIAALLSTASVGAFASDAQVNFDGEVGDDTCLINGSSSLSIIDVTLAKISKSALKNVGDWAQNTPFSLELTNCTAASTTVRWEPFINVDATTGALINQEVGGSNAQIRVLDAAYNPINMNNDLGITFTGASKTLNYFAQYYAKVVPVTTGLVKTYGLVTLTY
ncbi:type 1 fimbrial protein [Pseudomonas sp. PDNC002]|uniref:fimbrial protein n=1 Tax=Pseudomonas sp. PDNC002 TaxID=2811422 RepID=UPI0019661503|nr:fimbrial protein [Pseudomonas sp. PDNC002]QRY79076.1 type 1 fimbrial protein [Pseudomonas sp. PDNC002]